MSPSPDFYRCHEENIGRRGIRGETDPELRSWLDARVWGSHTLFLTEIHMRDAILYGLLVSGDCEETRTLKLPFSFDEAHGDFPGLRWMVDANRQATGNSGDATGNGFHGFLNIHNGGEEYPIHADGNRSKKMSALHALSAMGIAKDIEGDLGENVRIVPIPGSLLMSPAAPRRL